jgi:para-nitrobenzyl esterase
VSPEDASGNYGTLDLIQSLKWIRDNIEAFGGDPDRVTITGESAGGIDVLSLLISPPARGLFQRAMSQSGGALTRGMDEADSASQVVLERLLVQDGKARTKKDAAAAAEKMSAAEVRAYLESKNDRQLLRLYKIFGIGMVENPSILRDGVVIPLHGYDVLTSGDYPNKVPVILGSNADEMKTFLRFGWNLPWQNDFYEELSRFGTARWKVSAVDEVARRLIAHTDQPPVYAYQFRWGTVDADGKSPLPNLWGRELGAFHSAEIPFFLGNDTTMGVFQVVLYSRQNERGRKSLSAAMMEYLARFARTGDPNLADNSQGSTHTAEARLPQWRPWSSTPGGPKYIIFDTHGDTPALSMSTGELTDQGVMAAVKQDLREPLRGRVLRFLEESPLPAGVR